MTVYKKDTTLGQLRESDAQVVLDIPSERPGDVLEGLAKEAAEAERQAEAAESARLEEGRLAKEAAEAERSIALGSGAFGQGGR